MATTEARPRSEALRTAILAVMALLAACNSATTPTPTTATRSEVTETASATVGAFGLGAFPAFPSGELPDSTADALQTALDARVEDGTFTGVTATVIVADTGSWTGAAGSRDGVALAPDTPNFTHSAAKTVVAAEILKLVDDGALDLDDPASAHLPRALRFFDANGATIREVLGMRSGIPSLDEFSPEGGYYPAERASTVVEVFEALPEPTDPPGGEPDYVSTNYVLLGAVVEDVTGRSLAEALRSEVLDDPALDGIAYSVDDALAGDGWGVEATSASLARWGYELYGGSVVSDASLGDMTDFEGEWYGLGVMDLSGDYGTLAIGHEGESSVTTCCSVIRLVALPDEGVVIAVQAQTEPTEHPYDVYGYDVIALTQDLRDAALP